MNDLKLSVVIPAYNEENNLPPVLSGLRDERASSRYPTRSSWLTTTARTGLRR